MNFQEFGNSRNETILLLHGGGLCWWNFREEARLLQSGYHVILPILDGHAGSSLPFSTMENNAAEIISFIDEHLGGHVLLIGGLSLGGQILLEMLAQRGDICRYALVESAAVLPSRITRALISPAFGSSYGLIRNKTFAKMQFRSLHMDPVFFEDYYRDTCRIGKADMIAFLKASASYSLKSEISGTSAKVCVYFGEKENSVIRRSAEAVCRAVPGCGKVVLPGMVHGEFSLSHPQQYVQAVRDLTGRA